MRRLAPAAVALLLLAACQPAATELTQEQKAEVESTFRQFRSDLYAAAERLDAEAMLNSVAEDVALVIQGTRLSYDQWAPAVRNAFARFENQVISVLDMRIDVLAADAVANTDVIAVTVTDSTGNAVEQTYLHTEVCVKRDDHWVMIHGQQALAAEPM